MASVGLTRTSGDVRAPVAIGKVGMCQPGTESHGTFRRVGLRLPQQILVTAVLLLRCDSAVPSPFGQSFSSCPHT